MSDATFIARDLKLRGILKAETQSVTIQGGFEGELYAKSITILAPAICEGFMVAEQVQIKGRFSGILHCDNLVVQDEARISGEIVTDAIAIDSGADVTATVTRRTPQQKAS